MKDTSRVLALSLYIPNCDKKGFFKRRQVRTRLSLHLLLGFQRLTWPSVGSVSRPAGGGGASAGASIDLASRSPVSTTPAETSSAKNTRAVATATNESSGWYLSQA